MLIRHDKAGQLFKPYHEGALGIAMTVRSAFDDGKKWSARQHVASETEAAEKLKIGWHLWMEREDGSSKRPNLITPTSVEGWR